VTAADASTAAAAAVGVGVGRRRLRRASPRGPSREACHREMGVLVRVPTLCGVSASEKVFEMHCDPATHGRAAAVDDGTDQWNACVYALGAGDCIHRVMQHLVSGRQIRELASEHDPPAREFSRFPVHTERVQTNATLSQALMTCKIASSMEKTNLPFHVYPNTSLRQRHPSRALVQSNKRANEHALWQTSDSNDVLPLASTIRVRLACTGNPEPQTRMFLVQHVLRHAPFEQGLKQNSHRFARTGPDRRDRFEGRLRHGSVSAAKHPHLSLSVLVLTCPLSLRVGECG